MHRIANFVEIQLGRFVGLLMALMVVDVTWQVITRFVLNDPSAYTEEIARYLLIWIGLLGAAYAYRTHAHLGLDLLSQRLTGAKHHALNRFIAVVCGFFAATVMVYGGAKLMLLTLSLDQLSAALQVKIGYVYAVIPLSGVLIVFFALDELITGGPDMATPVTEAAE